MSTTIPTPTETAPNGVPDLSSADQPKPKTRFDKVMNGVALGAAGVALAAAGALAGLTYAQHAVDTWQAQYAARQKAAATAEAYVNAGLASHGAHKYGIASADGAQDGGPVIVRVDVYDATQAWPRDDGKNKAQAMVAVAQDGTPTVVTAYGVTIADATP